MSESSPASTTTAIVAEKPSVARDVAKVVGASKQGDGFLHGNGYVVTWAIGHLVSLAQPHEIRPEWKSWRGDLLPMLPQEWPLVVYEKTKPQFAKVQTILNSPKVTRVICATDAGREGELIFRYIYEAAQCDKPVDRLWISSLTPEAIRQGLANLKPGTSYDPLADAARGRSRADWLVGMNLSRAYSIIFNDKLSVGRVQTPTLAMLVERELEIRAFVAEDYLEVVATFSPKTADKPSKDAKFKATWFRGSKRDDSRLASDGKEANEIVARAQAGSAIIESLQGETQRALPLLLYDLTELQRHANRLFGFSAQKTLDVAQALYERHKLISYPRTDSRHLSTDVARTLPRIVQGIRGRYEGMVAPGTGETPLSKRYVDDAKVSDHHAILPTPVNRPPSDLSQDEARIYDLICRRLLMAWHDDYITVVTTVTVRIDSELVPNQRVEDRYHASGTIVEQMGWKVLDLAPPKKAAEKSTDKSSDKKDKDGPEKKSRAKKGDAAEDGAQQTLPESLRQGQPQNVLAVEAIQKKTRAPKRFTEGTLLTAMETAGKTLDEKELSDAMKENGLGTPATRASIIEVLLERQYAERQGKSLAATDKGIHLIEVVHPEVKSPLMTGQWEAKLQSIHKGKGALPPFLTGIEDYVRDVVGKVFSRGGHRPPRATAPEPTEGGFESEHSSHVVLLDAPPTAPSSPRTAASPTPARAPLASNGAAPARLPDIDPNRLPATSDADLLATLQSRFGFDKFRDTQQQVCQTVVRGGDALLVMPTGSGKSLCYQLPGVALAGTTLVVSPLIALMEDQVAKLQAKGFRAERIHSGRDRAASRAACIQYLNGELEFLFIAPERLRVAGFPEMLAKRKPTLIAIDEAHCISQWGHDFRPDYRMLGQYLPMFRPVPVIAMTATAAPRVQQDIASQLHLTGDRFVQGFRRENIAIEVVEVGPSERAAMVEALLQDPEHRPAIIYAPSRKETESLAQLLSTKFPCQAYHAGLDSDVRARVQTQFLDGRLEVICATVAFGMGIDKSNIRTVVHTATPGSIEAYYQEIGRAGRDGLPSRAILMQSYADRRMQDFFMDRSYPEPSLLEKVFKRLPDEPMDREALTMRSGMDMEVFAAALEKLWVHGGAVVDASDAVCKGKPGWEKSYKVQRDNRVQQIDSMFRFAECGACRMATLVGHFGDLKDSRTPCGICDFCSPADCVVTKQRGPTPSEKKVATKVLDLLSQTDTMSTGRLHTAAADSSLDRHDFERLLSGMARASLIEVTQQIFEKDGKSIPYRSASITSEGEAQADSPDFLLSQDIAKSSAAGSSKFKKGARGSSRSSTSRGLTSGPIVILPEVADIPREVKALKQWRLEEARKKGLPAFRILTDRALLAIVEASPNTVNALAGIQGVPAKLVKESGTQILAILRG